MTLADEVEGILADAVASLSRFEPEALEALEGRLVCLTEIARPGTVRPTTAVRARMEMLECCLRATESNMKILGRILDRELAS